MAANTNFAVAVHALSVLAYTGKLHTSEHIAASINTNAVVVRRIMRQLVNAGIVHSVAGKHGGFKLAVPAQEVRLAQVLHAVDEGAVFRIHNNETNPVCTVSCGIKAVLEKVLTKVDHAVDQELSRTTLADIAAAVRD